MEEKPQNPENGQAIVEYALIIVGISLVALLILNLTGVSIREVFCQVAGALGSQACSENQTACTFAFDEGSELDDWVGGDVGKSLQVVDGYLCNNNSRFNYFEGCNNEVSQEDFTANLNGIRITPTNNKHSGIDFMFRTDEKGNGYRFSYSSKDNVVLFWKKVNSKWVMLDWQLVPPEWGEQEVDFQIKADGDTFTASKDGELLLEATDDTFTDGKFAWRNKPGSKSCIDEISFQ